MARKRKGPPLWFQLALLGGFALAVVLLWLVFHLDGGEAQRRVVPYSTRHTHSLIALA